MTWMNTAAVAQWLCELFAASIGMRSDLPLVRTMYIYIYSRWPCQYYRSWLPSIIWHIFFVASHKRRMETDIFMHSISAYSLKYSTSHRKGEPFRTIKKGGTNDVIHTTLFREYRSLNCKPIVCPHFSIKYGQNMVLFCFLFVFLFSSLMLSVVVGVFRVDGRTHQAWIWYGG